MKIFKNTSVLLAGKVAVLSAALMFTGHMSLAQDAPFGQEDDIAYAQELWSVMDDARLVGDDAIHVQPFEGNEPHGAIQEVLATSATVEGHAGRLVVKRNHGGVEGLTVRQVYDNPVENLAAVTIMFKREEGYDPENQDWFWAKYLPDGELDQNPAGIKLAGRVAKGMDTGCIACHTAAGGEDLEVLTSD